MRKRKHIVKTVIISPRLQRGQHKSPNKACNEAPVQQIGNILIVCLDKIRKVHLRTQREKIFDGNTRSTGYRSDEVGAGFASTTPGEGGEYNHLAQLSFQR